MNIVNKLTVRQLKLNKKRTLVTIIGVIISVAMVTAVATLGVSFCDLLIRQTIASDGEWHALYENVNQTQLEAIRDDLKIKTVILSRDVGYAPLEGSRNQNKIYVFIREYNQEGFAKFPIHLSEGRLPENSNEIVISETIASNAGVYYKIGDVVNFSIGLRYSRNPEDGHQALSQNTSLLKNKDGIQEFLEMKGARTYTIVGIIKRPEWEPAWSPGYTALSCLDESSISSENTANAAVIFNRVHNALFEHGNSMAEKLGIQKVVYNDSLLRWYGVVKDDSVRSTFFNLSAIIIVIIMVGSISLIYNAFAISVSERSRYLGMLASVGATRRQKRNSVFFEGLIIGLISIPFGVIAGLAGMHLTFLCINPMVKNVMGVTERLRLVVLPSSVLVGVLVSAVTIFISTYSPARRASRISAIDAIRQTGDVKFTGREVKTLRITRKIFGIEGDLGLKNLKRNRGRYKATVFSLVISMVLFLAVSAFTLDMKKSLSLYQNGINYDISVVIESGNKEELTEAVQKINSLEDITKISHIDEFQATSWILEDSMADYLKGGHENMLKNGNYPYKLIISALDDQSLKEYAREVGIDFSRMKEKGKISAIVVDTVKFRDMEAGKFVEAKAVKTRIGEILELSFYSRDLEKEVSAASVEIAALTDKMPMGIMSPGKGASFHVILSKDALEMITETSTDIREAIRTRILLKSANPLRLQERLESIQNMVKGSNFYIYNAYLARQKDEQLILIMSVFTFGFILLITAICIANILNTVSTSIALRKREFAMLKSVGMTPKGFSKMINYESIFYGLKALLYGLPVSFAVMFLIHRALMEEFSFVFIIPWTSLCITIAAVFILVAVAMLYSGVKVRKENIIDALKQDII